MLSFIKRNIYVIAGAFCLVVICAVYFTQNGGRGNSLEAAGEDATVIYSSEADTPDPDEETEPEPSQPSEEPKEIQVYITGEVLAPGVYTVPSDARVWQVLEQAGGFTEDAAEDYVNLAARVTDAQQIAVPSADDSALESIAPGTTDYGVTSNGAVPSAPPPAENGSPSEAAAENGEPTGDLVNINTADSTLLQTLPGIGEAIASYIIEYREANGGFESTDEILNVPRIGSATFDKIKDRITIGGM